MRPSPRQTRGRARGRKEGRADERLPPYADRPLAAPGNRVCCRSRKRLNVEEPGAASRAVRGSRVVTTSTSLVAARLLFEGGSKKGTPRQPIQRHPFGAR